MSKKPSEKTGGGSGESDELELLKARCLAKDLEVFTIKDKMHHLEERSQLMEQHMEHVHNSSAEKIEKMSEIINYLTSEGHSKDKKFKQVETDLVNAQQELKEMKENFAKKMMDATNAHEFSLQSMQLQLNAASTKLREMHEFALNKKALEEELARLKERLLKEERDHAEAYTDLERNSILEKDRLRKEILTRVEETRKEMNKVMEEQLHETTKKTILENEKLRTEVAYHTHQTTLLLHENRKLLAEFTEANRSLILAKELEDDLARRNHLYQKATRILVHKLREKQLSSSQQERRKEENNEIQEILIRSQQFKAAIPGHHQKGPAHAKEKPRDDAIKFLYACLEDIELERMTKAPAMPSSEFSSNMIPELPLDQFNLEQRQNLLKNLLRLAVSLQSMTANLEREAPSPSLAYSAGSHADKGKAKIHMEDILALPIDQIMDEPGGGHRGSL